MGLGATDETPMYKMKQVFFLWGNKLCIGVLVVGICGIGILSRDCIHLNLLHLVLVRSKLYQYGLDAGDKASDKKDDACTNVYTQNITMYGMNFDKIYVSDQCSPCSFPHVSQSQYKCRFQRHCSTMKQSECLSQMLEVFHHLPTLEAYSEINGDVGSMKSVILFPRFLTSANCFYFTVWGFTYSCNYYGAKNLSKYTWEGKIF